MNDKRLPSNDWARDFVCGGAAGPLLQRIVQHVEAPRKVAEISPPNTENLTDACSRRVMNFN